ncbi:ABC transporter permease [Microbacterium sp. No. 7]|uniref:ABC transporter permease n=1 Tax=Microbacterium sp. No. 7 TaxID=1714373 RepID=UPI0006D23270|nr:ABC transporter permease [Microbacterium sp. No. 7]ALJ21538.1 hypothetical protein AOA12_17230 [Microbacterium sp. No. 7]
MTPEPHWISTVVAIGVLAAVATAALAVFGVRSPWAPAAAIARGVVQLAVLSFVLTGIIAEPGWIALALVVMFVVAASVGARRMGWSMRAFAICASAIGLGVGVALTVVFVTRALEFSPRYVLAVGAIVIGNAMTVATLTGRRFTEAVADHWDEVEGWLALGARPRIATLDLARRSVRDALIPSIDQTRTTGLVVLPGAFVGAIFGGLSPLEAGRFQIIVLAAIMAAGALTAVTVVLWLGPVRTKRFLSS